MSLDINFNFGEFQSDGGHTVEILITVFSIIATAIISILIQRIYDNYKHNEGLDAFYSHIKRGVTTLSGAAFHQAEALKELVTVLRKKEVGDFSAGLISEFDVDLIGDWNTMDLEYSIVARRDAEKSILIDYHSQIKTSLNKLRRNARLIEKYFDDLNLKYKEVQNDWQAHVQSIGDLLDYYRLPPQPVDDFLKEYDSIVHKWQQQGKNTEMSFVYDNLVTPLLDLCVKYRGDFRAWQLEREVLRCSGAYKEMNHLKSRYADWFEKVGKRLIEIKDKINNSFLEVERIKLKSLYQLYVEKI